MASVNQEEGCERLGKLLFLKLDPTLRCLLAVLQQQQQHQEGNTVTTAMELEKEEKLLGLFRAETKLLKEAQQTLQDFFANSYSAQPEDTAGALVILMDYLSLPVVAILRRPLTSNRNTTNTNDVEESDPQKRKRLIRQSAERKSILVASQTLQMCLQFLGSRQKNAESPSGKQISQSKLLDLILAFSSALPTGQELAQQSTDFNSRGLDRGEDYLESLLEVLSQLLQLVQGGQQEALANAMDGSLLAHLADVCVAAATSDFFSETTIGKALTLLQNLLEVVPDVSIWRALFPGCFAVSDVL